MPDTSTFWQDLLDPGGPVEVSDQRGTTCRTRGDVYCTLRCFECTDAATGQVEIFFRTVPLLPDNPMIVLSTTSTTSQQPLINGVKVIFLDQNRNLQFVSDLTSYQEDSNTPIQINDASSVGTTPPPVDSGLEAHYGLSPDWVVWAGGSQSQLYSRSLATLPSSSINLISGTLLENSEPAIKDTRVVWRGRDPGSGRIEVYYKDLLSGASPIRVSDNTVF